MKLYVRDVLGLDRFSLILRVKEKTKNNLFLGARSDARKLIFLVTDGKQTPQVDDFDTNIKLDPVKASENLWNDKNTAIFTVGVGPKVKVEHC